MQSDKDLDEEDQDEIDSLVEEKLASFSKPEVRIFSVELLGKTFI